MDYNCGTISTLPGKRPQYGKEAWKLVNCWLNDVWNWSDVTRTLENIKAAEYPGPGRLVDFYKDCIKKRLLSKDFSEDDFDTYYDTNKIDTKKKTKRDS